jgi:SAM-dependent methyltransferase
MAILAPHVLRVLACASCGGRVDAEASSVCCRACGRRFPVSGGIPNLRGELDARVEAVRDFYSVAPFPGYPPRDSYPALRVRAGRSEFARLLDRAIAPDASVLEVGCGTGQMSLFLATGDRLVIGADLTRASLELATAAARRFGIERVRFVETDLRNPGLRAGAFDVVYCSGVLHHTPDPRASFRAIARLVRPGGFIVVGVYNAYARIPHRLRRAIARLTGFRWIPLDPVLRDRAAELARRAAWLQDQYRHPRSIDTRSRRSRPGSRRAAPSTCGRTRARSSARGRSTTAGSSRRRRTTGRSRTSCSSCAGRGRWDERAACSP